MPGNVLRGGNEAWSGASPLVPVLQLDKVPFSACVEALQMYLYYVDQPATPRRSTVPAVASEASGIPSAPGCCLSGSCSCMNFSAVGNTQRGECCVIKSRDLLFPAAPTASFQTVLQPVLLSHNNISLSERVAFMYLSNHLQLLHPASQLSLVPLYLRTVASG